MKKISELKRILRDAETVLIGAGAGLSTAAGFIYDGERFQKYFADFAAAYGFDNMYDGGFYPYDTPEEFWGFWCRNIFVNRYDLPPSEVHAKLLALVRDKNYFVLTTNVDHLFQLNGFDKTRLFYTQGDYGLIQCPTPCHQKTYDNESVVRKMLAAERFSVRGDNVETTTTTRRDKCSAAFKAVVPTELLPRCPKCGKVMIPNLRADDNFVEDSGWHAAAYRYEKFLNLHASGDIVYLELGVGANTPGIIKYPFWRLTAENPRARYVCVNFGEAFVPDPIAAQSLTIDADIAKVVDAL